MNEINIGELIETEMLRQERSAWLASKLYCSRTNIYKIYGRTSIDTTTLYRVSRVLGHNFFSYYAEAFEREKMETKE